MIRAEQVSIQDAMIEAELKLSPPGFKVPVRIDRGTMAGVTSVLRDELRACEDDEGRLKVADSKGIDLLDLFGRFWNAEQAQSENRKPRNVTLSDREIGYISGLSSESHASLTEVQQKALRGFRSASAEAVRKHEKETAKGKRSTSGWFDSRW